MKEETYPIFEIEGFDSADGKWYPLYYYHGESRRKEVNNILRRLKRANDAELSEQGGRVAEMDDFRISESVGKRLVEPPKSRRRMVEAKPAPRPAKSSKGSAKGTKKKRKKK